MSTDNRTELNDCESATGWLGQGKEAVDSLAGQQYEGSSSIKDQHSNADEDTYTGEDSLNTGTFSIDFSDVTMYALVKDNLVDTFAAGGTQLIIASGVLGADRNGYIVGGNDVVGLPLSNFFNCYKLDCSNLPGSPISYAGSAPTITTITSVGVGTLHLAKAQGSLTNMNIDYISYIANDSYALTINGGTGGTPETMADVAADDVTNGWGLVSNPLGSMYQFFGPIEWAPAAASDSYFAASGEQWFWIGDNAGGHAVGATHFPFRVAGLTGQTNSFVINNVVIVNTGTASDFDCEDAFMDTLEIDGCSVSGLASFNAPSLGGTSRFCTNTLFSLCGTVTHNGANMSGCSFLDSIAAANGDAIYYNETVDPDGEMDGMTFVQGAAAHHAMTFGADIPISITIRGADFTGFSSSDDNDGSVFQFEDTGATTITLNLVECSHDGSGFTVDARAGCTVNIVIDPVTTIVHVDDAGGDDLQSARVLVEASDDTGDFPFEDVVTITRVSTTASVAHTGHDMIVGDLVVIRNAEETEYNGSHIISNVTTNAYDYTVAGSPTTPANGTITATGAIISGLTDVNGDISASRTFGSDTPIRGSVRKATGSPFFKAFTIGGEITSAGGAAINVRMIADE